MQKTGKLYLIPTPIGNLEDITLRALRLLKEVDYILAEDTRQTAKLLNHYEIKKELRSFHSHNEHQALHNVLKDLDNGKIIAQVSDAGTPGISDPGFLLSRACVAAAIPLECLPGATAFVPALVKSGLPCDEFVFLGFLPEKKGRQTALKNLAQESRTSILYESPMRLIKTLTQLMEFCGPERVVSVSRELTKIYEETQTGTLTAIIDYFGKGTVKGEIVLIINGHE